MIKYARKSTLGKTRSKNKKIGFVQTAVLLSLLACSPNNCNCSNPSHGSQAEILQNTASLDLEQSLEIVTAPLEEDRKQREKQEVLKTAAFERLKTLAPQISKNPELLKRTVGAALTGMSDENLYISTQAFHLIGYLSQPISRNKALLRKTVNAILDILASGGEIRKITALKTLGFFSPAIKDDRELSERTVSTVLKITKESSPSVRLFAKDLLLDLLRSSEGTCEEGQCMPIPDSDNFGVDL